ncbi:MAG: site-specific integrase [Candidatus Dormibacteria bacterium]
MNRSERMYVPTDAVSPVDTYLAQLSPGSRRVMAQSLEVIADALSQGKSTAADFPWQKATYRDAVRLRAWLIRGYATSTAARHLTAWRCVLRETWRHGQMSTDSYMRARDVRSPRQGARRRGRLLEVAEVAALLDVSDPSRWDIRDKAMVAILAGCGLREAELAGMLVEDVNPASGELHVRVAKGDRPRDLVLPRQLRQAVEKWVELRGSEPGNMFKPLGPTGRVLDRRLSVSGIVWALNRLTRKAGGAAFSPHSVRRFYATGLSRSGVDLITIQLLMGHAHVSTTAQYVLKRPVEAPPEAEGLWNALAPPRLRVAREEAA